MAPTKRRRASALSRERRTTGDTAEARPRKRPASRTEAAKDDDYVLQHDPPLLPTINFADGQSMNTPMREDGSAWSSDRSGIMSAQLSATSEPCRLLGYKRIWFDAKKIEKEWKWLHRPIAATEKTKSKKHKIGIERFNINGEPVLSSTEPIRRTTVGRLLTRCTQGHIVARTSEDMALLNALNANQCPANVDRFKAPIFRTLCYRVNSDQSETLCIELRVYATRILFYLIADESIRTVVSALDSLAPIRKLREPPQSFNDPALLVNTNSNAQTPFTLEAVMRSAEHPGGPEAQVPKEIDLEMKPYQKQALYWMSEMERRDLNEMFWEKRAFFANGHSIHPNDEVWYYSPDLGECRLEAPPRSSGGVLADEMGLGKTLESVALICARPATTVDDRLLPPLQDNQLQGPIPDQDMASTTSIEDEAEGLIMSRATLVVVPAALASQWSDECAKSCKPGTMRVATLFTDSDRRKYCSPFIKKGSDDQSRLDALIELASQDIVITTYGVVNGTSTSSYLNRTTAHVVHNELLRGIYWHRLLLDEMQYVASPSTQLARRCAALKSRTRWMVSGTPLSDGIGDLNGELRFLGVWPFSLSDASDGFWEHAIGDPWSRREPEALARLECLLRRVILRRSKAQSYGYGELFGRPLLDLPRRGDITVGVTPPPAEAGVLTAIEALVAALFKSGVTSHADLYLRLTRNSANSTQSLLLQDADLNALCRLYNQRVVSTNNRQFTSAFAGSGLISFQPRVVSPGDAIALLTSRDNSQHIAQGRRAEDDLLVGGAIQLQRNELNNFVGGREAVSTARNSSRVLSTLALSQRLVEARAQYLHLEAQRQQAKNQVRSCLLNWMLLQFALGRGDHMLTADVTLDGEEEEEVQCTRTRAQVGAEDPALDRARATTRDRRHQAIAKFLVVSSRSGIIPTLNQIFNNKVQKGTPVVSSDGRRLDRELRPLPYLRWLCTEDDGRTLKDGNDQLDIFSWRAAKEETRRCSETIGEIQLQLLSVHQHIRRLESSVQELRTQRDVKAEQSEKLYAQAAHFRAHLQKNKRALLELVDAIDMARAAVEMSVAETGFAQRSLAAAKEAAESRLLEMQAARLKSSEEKEKREALDLDASEVNLCDTLSQARSAANESRRYAEELGADATEDQKKNFEALQARKPSENAEKGVKDAWREEEKQFRQNLSAEARHFFYPSRNEFNIGINTQSGDALLQYRITQQGVKDLSRLEDKRERPSFRCPCCFGYLDYEFLPETRSALRLCITPCLHLTCESCAVNQILHAGVQHAMRNRFLSQQQALNLADQGRLESPCVICRRLFRLDDCLLVTRGPANDKAEFEIQASISEAHMEEEEIDSEAESPPRYRSAVEVEKALRLPPLSNVNNEPRRDVRHPNIPLELLRYLSAARQQAHSAKIGILLSDIKRILRDDPLEKMVVFTTIRGAVTPVASALELSGIGHETLVSASSSGISESVRRWQNDTTCNIFVINAGVAAAGLTLTAARYIFLLEPFLSKGQELQAMNRCHRIGQQRQVNTVTYFIRNSIEERILAYRSRATGPTTENYNELSIMAAPGDSRSIPPGKLRYLFGVDDNLDDFDQLSQLEIPSAQAPHYSHSPPPIERVLYHPDDDMFSFGSSSSSDFDDDY